MIYCDFKGKKISMLGLGLMRLPMTDEKTLNEAEFTKMLDYAMENGVNYYDTAWGYIDGLSETYVAKYFGKYPRESYYIADKFPGYDSENWSKIDEIFNAQLKKCNLDYFDFYLLHCLCESNVDAYLDEEKYGIMPYLLQKKKEGKIKHLGFSVHAEFDVFNRFLEKYGDIMEFCQVQLNYLDWHYQDAEKKVRELNKRGIPVWVMEPVRGGKLAVMPEKTANEIKKILPNDNLISSAFRFLHSIEGVSVILSGMSDLAQIKQNVEIFSKLNPLTNEEFEKLTKTGDIIASNGSVNCTACSYCTSYCPRSLNIPHLISLYNESLFSSSAPKALNDEKHPKNCIACKACENVCPQKIEISKLMANYSEKLS